MKCALRQGAHIEVESLPVRGAWIEIPARTSAAAGRRLSLPVRGAWIEIASSRSYSGACASLPVRGAWIEMWCSSLLPIEEEVAPRAGSVD